MPLTQPPDHGIFLLAFVPIAHRGKEQTSTHRPSRTNPAAPFRWEPDPRTRFGEGRPGLIPCEL